MNGDLMVGREMNDLDGLIGVATPVITTLPAETSLDALVHRCFVIDNAVHTQGLEQLDARVITIDGHVGNRLQGFSVKIGFIGSLNVTGSESLSVKETGEHVGVHIL